MAIVILNTALFSTGRQVPSSVYNALLTSHSFRSSFFPAGIYDSNRYLFFCLILFQIFPESRTFGFICIFFLSLCRIFLALFILPQCPFFGIRNIGRCIYCHRPYGTFALFYLGFKGFICLLRHICRFINQHIQSTVITDDMGRSLAVKCALGNYQQRFRGKRLLLCPLSFSRLALFRKTSHLFLLLHHHILKLLHIFCLCFCGPVTFRRSRQICFCFPITACFHSHSRQYIPNPLPRKNSCQNNRNKLASHSFFPPLPFYDPSGMPRIFFPPTLHDNLSQTALFEVRFQSGSPFLLISFLLAP